MASIAGAPTSLQACLPRHSSGAAGRYVLKTSVSLWRTNAPKFQRCLRVSCAAKKETVDKICQIVKKQLALPDETAVTAESEFVKLGADSLDTVEVIMAFEEEFGITVEEESAQAITTVQGAADLIEKLIEQKA
ncbi:hypothetical protein Dimus_021755 [Dionaea muscipula]